MTDYRWRKYYTSILDCINRWRHNNDVINQKIYAHVQNKIHYKMFISDFSYLNN